MKTIKKAIFKLLGLKAYLRLLHKGFRFAYKTRLLQYNHVYKYHYFDRHFIKAGDHVMDLGANLGYYTLLFSNWTSDHENKGRVYAVEPVTCFFETLRWATRKSKNVSLYNFALGAEEKEVIMVTPGKYGYLRTGLAHIPQTERGEEAEFTFKAAMKKAGSLFSDLPKLDFIKCDIEGYEEVVLPEMQSLLEKFKPPIQLESWGDHKSKIILFLKGLGYEIYGVEHNVLRPADQLKDKRFGDFIFVHKENPLILHRLGKRYKP